MKKFKNLENYAEATQYIKNYVFNIPVSEMELVEEQEEEVIAKIIFLFDNAKNSVVRAAIHHHALGDKVYLDTQEEKETGEGIHYKGMFCQYFNQTRNFAQLRCYDGSAKSGRVLTKIDTYIVDDNDEEHFIQYKLKKYLDFI